MIIKKCSPASTRGKKTIIKVNKLPLLKSDTFELGSINKKRKLLSFGAKSRLKEFNFNNANLEKIFNAMSIINDEESQNFQADILRKMKSQIDSREAQTTAKEAGLKTLERMAIAAENQAGQVVNYLVDKSLNDNESAIRTCSAEALGKVGLSINNQELEKQVEEALTASNKGINDPNASVRKASVEALSGLASSTDNEGLQTNLVNSLLNTENKCINDKDSSVRMAVAQGLGTIGSTTYSLTLKNDIEKKLIALARGINDSIPDVRKSSVEALGYIAASTKNQKLQNEIVTHLSLINQGIHDRDRVVKESSVKALMSIALADVATNDLQKNIVGTFTSLYQDLSDIFCFAKKTAVIAMGEIAANTKDHDLQETIFQLLTAPNQGIQGHNSIMKASSVEALANIGAAHPHCAHKIVDLLKGINDEDKSVKESLAKALEQIAVKSSDKQLQGNVSSIIVTKVSQENLDSKTKKILIGVLGKIAEVTKDQQLQKGIVTYLTTPDQGIYDRNSYEARITSARALGSICIKTYDEDLQRNIAAGLTVPGQGINSSGSFEMKKTSVEALGKIASSTYDNELRRDIFYQLNRPDIGVNDNYSGVKIASVEVLGKLGDVTENERLLQDVYKVLNAIIRYNDPLVQIAAIKALTNIAKNRGYLCLNVDNNLKRIDKIILENLETIEASTKNPDIYAETIACRKDFESNDFDVFLRPSKRQKNAIVM